MKIELTPENAAAAKKYAALAGNTPAEFGSLIYSDESHQLKGPTPK